MKPWEKLDSVETPDGTRLDLLHHDGDYVIYADGFDLMTSRMHGSEDAMMALAYPDPVPDACILVGGLGMGYTLRATLDLLPATATVIVSELTEAVVRWNRGPLGPLAGHPLDDPRVSVELGDVAIAMRRGVGRFDAILLDVDNGPEAMTQKSNSWLYTPAGLDAAHRALRPLGALAIWSAVGEPSFEKRLHQAGFTPKAHVLRARGVGKGPKHVVFVGQRR